MPFKRKIKTFFIRTHALKPAPTANIIHELLPHFIPNVIHVFLPQSKQNVAGISLQIWPDRAEVLSPKEHYNYFKEIKY